MLCLVQFCQGSRPGAGQTCWASVWKSTTEPPGVAAQCSVPPGPDQQVCREKPGTAAGYRSQQPPHVREYRVWREGEAWCNHEDFGIKYQVSLYKNRCIEMHKGLVCQLSTVSPSIITARAFFSSRFSFSPLKTLQYVVNFIHFSSHQHSRFRTLLINVYKRSFLWPIMLV